MSHPKKTPQRTNDLIFWHRAELASDRFLSSILASTELDTLWNSGTAWGFMFSAYVTLRGVVLVEGRRNIAYVAFVRDRTAMRRIRRLESTILNQSHANTSQTLRKKRCCPMQVTMGSNPSIQYSQIICWFP